MLELRGKKILKIKDKELKSDLEDYPYFIDEILKRIFSFERILLRYTNLPFSVSILCIAKKYLE